MIKIENISFKYKDSDWILENLNFNIYEGEILAIVGKNGSGKSTIGKLICGIYKVKKGKILIDNLSISEKKNEKKIREKIGIVFQNPENQIIFNNIKDEISFSLKELNKEEIEKRVKESLEKVEMSEFKEKDLYSLSLGQKQRIMIAEVLAKNPKYIILDEPTSMIDSLGKEKIYEIMRKLRQQGYTIICITNHADELLLADRILILENRKIVEEIKKEELLEKIDCLKKYQIKIPTILEMLGELKRDGINLDIKEYTNKNFIHALKEKLKK